MQRFTATARSALIAATGLAALTSIGALSAPAFAEIVEDVKLVTFTLWARQDISGPLRAGNVVKAAVLLNEALAEEAEEEDPAEAGVYRLRLGEVNGARGASDGA